MAKLFMKDVPMGATARFGCGCTVTPLLDLVDEAGFRMCQHVFKIDPESVENEHETTQNSVQTNEQALFLNRRCPPEPHTTPILPLGKFLILESEI